MKTKIHKTITPPLITSSVLFILLITIGSCKKGEEPKFLKGYQQTNLVADTLGFNAAIIDKNLVNAWGMAVVPSGPIWISSNEKSLSVIYNSSGQTLFGPITILGGGSAPSGQVFNTTTSFVIAGTGKPAKFIFANEDGRIAAWNGGTDAGLVADGTKWGAVYKGIAIANDGTGDFLYATNFKGQKIDVFDSMFVHVTDKKFEDPYIPSGFGPFNIRNINGYLFVTYAKLKAPDDMDDEAGPGNGFVDIFTTDGKFVKRFASRGPLNSPWGILPVPEGIDHVSNAILIGNFGDGRINVYDQHGNFVGQLRDNNGHSIAIDGLWAIENNIPGAASPDQIFFTAGPDDESHGLFGYLSK
jgi:uncharacterized protein (TIGR03118 family)